MGKIIPNKIKPTHLGIQLFSLILCEYDFCQKSRIFTVSEKSGIIRSGFTLEFYQKNNRYFKTVN